MFTIQQKTRIQEGASWEDIQSGDCYETGYEICDEDGNIIYDFADEDIRREFDEANRKEIANRAAIVGETASDIREAVVQANTLEYWLQTNPILCDGTMAVILNSKYPNYLAVGDGKTSIMDLSWMSMRTLKAIKKNWDVVPGLIAHYAEADKDK